jgi:intein-encoded DNA endonuclease-like protein
LGAETFKKQQVCQLTGAKFGNQHIDVNTAKTYCIRKEIKPLEFNQDEMDNVIHSDKQL